MERSQEVHFTCISTSGRTVDTGLFGYFGLESKSNEEPINSEISTDVGSFFYQPTTRFLDESNLTLQENEYNLNPYKETGKALVKTSIASIAGVCNCNQETVSYILLEFIRKLSGVSRQSAVYPHLIILDVKIGYLKIKASKIRFLNYFEAKKKGVRTLISDRASQMNDQEDAVS